MCIVDLTLTTPDTTSPVQLLKKLKGKESENLTVVLVACAITDVGASSATISITTIMRDNGLNPFPKRFIANLLWITEHIELVLTIIERLSV